MTTVLGLLLCFALALAGCKTVQQSQQTQTDTRSPNADSYSRSYQAEVTHRHHHSRSGEARDNWQSYDRGDTADASAGSSGQQAQGESQNHARAGRRSGGRAVTSAPGQFDFYLLNLSWSPEFCHGHPDAAECSQHRAFTLHGLWPQRQRQQLPGRLQRSRRTHPRPRSTPTSTLTLPCCSTSGRHTAPAPASHRMRSSPWPAGLSNPSRFPPDLLTLASRYPLRRRRLSKSLRRVTPVFPPAALSSVAATTI